MKTLSRPSRWRLFASQMYEGMLLLAIAFVTLYIVDSLTQRSDPQQWSYGIQALLFIALGVYFILNWWRKGQTLPMKTWGIRLCRNDGNKPRLWQLLGRYVLAWCLPLLGAYGVQVLSIQMGWPSVTILVIFTPFLNFVYSWFDAQGKFLHDRIMRTRLELFSNTPYNKA